MIDYLASWKHYSCTTALLKMTEDFKATLDIKEHCAAIVVDLAKAFDSALAIGSQGWGPIVLLTVPCVPYLGGRKQRVRIGNFYFNWRTIKHGFPQGAILGPPVLVGLDFLTGWNVLISFVIRLLMNLAKSTPYGDLIRRNIADTYKP